MGIEQDGCMRVLVACEFSGVVREAFRKRGHDAWSCDLLPTEAPGQHFCGDVKGLLGKRWDLMIAHPPCTYLTNAGVRHLHDSVTSKNGNKTKVVGSERWVKMFEAAEFFRALWNAPIPKIAIENPVPHGYAAMLIGRYTQLVQPWMFGHGETKATCFWLKNLPPLEPTKYVTGRYARVHMTSPGPNRWKERSRTYQGIADAMAEQWGSL